MKPPLAQFQSDRRKQRANAAFQNRLENLRSEMLLRVVEAQSRPQETYILTNNKPDVKWHSWRKWFEKIKA